MKKHPVIITLATILGIVGTLFAISDQLITTATFTQYKEYVGYRFDVQDKKLDLILEQQK